MSQRGETLDSGRVGPFWMPMEAGRAATIEALEHGAETAGTRGFVQVRDARGNVMGTFA